MMKIGFQEYHILADGYKEEKMVDLMAGDFLKEVGDDEEVLYWLGEGLKDTILKNLAILLHDQDLHKEIVDAANVLLQTISKNIVNMDVELSIRKEWRIVCEKNEIQGEER